MSTAPIPLGQILTDLLNSLSSVFANRSPAILLPPQIVGGLRQPDGSAGAQLQIEVLLPAPTAAGGASSTAGSSSSSSGGAGAPQAYVIATGLTDPSGNFSLALPNGVTLPSGQSLSLRVRGGASIANPTGASSSSAGSSSSGATATAPAGAIISVPPPLLGLLGYVGTFTLSQRVTPIPTPIYLALLANGASGGPLVPAQPLKPSMPHVRLGDDSDCVRVIENQSSSDRFPFGIFFRLAAPQLCIETEAPPGVTPGSTPAAPAATATSSVRARSRGPLTTSGSSSSSSGGRVDTPIARVALDGPVDIGDFRNGLTQHPRIAGTVGLGYILRCAQRWTFQGIALGDLVYSLPLAPGEQQQIVLVDQQTSLRLADSQTIVAEQQADSTASSDSSTQSVFSSALNQFANGTSTQNATSTTTGGATSGGLVGLVLGGSSGSTGTTTTSGTNTSSMDGVQNYASNAAQSMQNNAAQQSMLARRGQSTSIRAASASETTSVTTKTITNHNKLHALTLQYFEAVRLYDISTAFESATLVALVPLDVVWFLPPGQPQQLPDITGAADATSAVQIASTLANIAAAQLALLAQATAIAAAPFNIGLATVRQTGNSLATTAAAGGQLAAAAQNLNNLLSAAGSVMAGIANDIVTAQLPKIQAAVAQYNADTSNNPIALASELNQSVPGLTAIQQQATTIKQQLALPASNAMSRQHVLARYAGLLANSDVLQRSLPRRFRSGLTRLDRFAADPSATVALNSLAEDVIQISANASALPFDHVYVTVVTRWGSRLGPIEMLPSPPVTIPGQFDVNGRFKTTQDLLQYLQTQRNPGISSAPVLQASIALPRTLSPSDVMGFEITHTTDAFSYQLAAPSEIATSTLGSLFGTNGSAWPPAIQNLLGGLLTSTLPTPASPPAATFVTYTPNDIATRIGPPYMWNFAANLLAGVQGNYEPYVSPARTAVELPPDAYPIPAAEVAPILKNSDLLLIESTLQHVLRYQVAYSKAVWGSLSSEERAMLLEPYQLSFTGPSVSAAAVTAPLLDCVANEVLGFYGNCMLMPFSVPPSVAAPLQTTTGAIEDALLRFHLRGAPKEVTRVALPTRGVLGEAMLGHCASGEKIDLTRFWNWQDSPADTAPAIQPVTVPQSMVSALTSAQSPNTLAGVLSALGSPSAAAATPSASDVALASALAQKAPAAAVPDLSNAAQLATLLGSTQTTAAQARQDALKTQAGLIQDTIDQAAGVIKAIFSSGSSSSSKSSSSKSTSSSSSSSAASGSSSANSSSSSSSA